VKPLILELKGYKKRAFWYYTSSLCFILNI
jgi:hypothetical protein